MNRHLWLFLVLLFLKNQSALACASSFSQCVRGCGTPATTSDAALTQNQCYQSCYTQFESCNSTTGGTTSSYGVSSGLTSPTQVAAPVDPRMLQQLQGQVQSLQAQLFFMVQAGASADQISMVQAQLIQTQKTLSELTSLAQSQATEIQKALIALAQYRQQRDEATSRALQLANLLGGGTGAGSSSSSGGSDILSLLGILGGNSVSSPTNGIDPLLRLLNGSSLSYWTESVP